MSDDGHDLSDEILKMLGNVLVKMMEPLNLPDQSDYELIITFDRDADTLNVQGFELYKKKVEQVH